jgi:LAO/AO transport system kinase
VVTAGDVLLRIQGSDLRALPRLATLVENEDPRALEALDALFPLTGQAQVVGVTGPPGAGKSTLIAALLGHVRAASRRVAVLAVDPSSPISGGAVLGDRIRMMDRHADDGVFVRSMASRGRQGGLAWATARLVHLLDAVGYPLILIETVGTGQDGTDIASLADTVLVVESPGLGDGVQAIKSGLLEVADIVAVNKADQPGAEDAQRLLRASFNLAHPSHGRSVPILPTVGITGSGMSELLAAIDDHAAWLAESGQRAVRRERGARAEVLAGLRAALDRRLEAGPVRSPELADLIGRVARRDLSPRRAVNALVVALDSPASGRSIGD